MSLPKTNALLRATPNATYKLAPRKLGPPRECDEPKRAGPYLEHARSHGLHFSFAELAGYVDLRRTSSRVRIAELDLHSLAESHNSLSSLDRSRVIDGSGIWPSSLWSSENPRVAMVTRRVGHALANRELEQTAEALCVYRARETCTPKAPAEHFSAGVTRLPRKRIEAGEVVFIDPKGNDTGFRLPRLDWAAWSGRHLVRLHWARSSKTARASSRKSACRELERTLRAKLPKVSAVGVSPTSALPCVELAVRFCQLAKRFPESAFRCVLFR